MLTALARDPPADLVGKAKQEESLFLYCDLSPNRCGE
jgi:hypothetical protein